MIGRVISENDPPYFAPWVILAHHSRKISEALQVIAYRVSLNTGLLPNSSSLPEKFLNHDNLINLG